MRPIARTDRTPTDGLGDAAIAPRPQVEDVVIGDEIVRERLRARVVH